VNVARPAGLAAQDSGIVGGARVGRAERPKIRDPFSPHAECGANQGQ
jgi:hypothetical protein